MIQQQTSPWKYIYGSEKDLAELLSRLLNNRVTINTGVVLESYKSFINLRHIYGKGAHFQHISALGRGAFGAVHKYRDITSNADFVVKHLQLEKMQNIKTRRSLEREVEGLLKFNNVHIIKLVGLIIEESKIGILLESWGFSLKAYLTRVFPTEQDMSVWFLQLLSGLNYIHSNGYVHCDMHLGNILLHGNHIKICDLGSLKKAFEEELDTYSHGNTPAYFPPTALRYFLNEQQIKVSPRLDTFAVGKILLEIVLGRSNAFITVEEMKPYILEKKTWDDFVTKQIPEYVDPKIQKLIIGLMSYTTKDGLSTNEAMELIRKH